VWFEEEVKPRLRGESFEIRYADDGLLCFQFKEDAERVLEVLPKRFAKYGLTLHPEKTRLVKFGRSAYYQAKRTKTKTATFDFLGFTHRCATSRAGNFIVQVSTMKKRLRRALVAIVAWCREHLHEPLDYQQQKLNAKLRGHYQYYGRPTNYRSLEKFVYTVRRIWRRWLARRTRGNKLSWERFKFILVRYPLLRPRITHAWQAW
jgi:RNA-directed DNA polymerase